MNVQSFKSINLIFESYFESLISTLKDLIFFSDIYEQHLPHIHLRSFRHLTVQLLIRKKKKGYQIESKCWLFYQQVLVFLKPDLYLYIYISINPDWHGATGKKRAPALSSQRGGVWAMQVAWRHPPKVCYSRVMWHKLRPCRTAAGTCQSRDKC